MSKKKLVAGAVALGVAASATGVGVATGATTPNHASITEAQTFKVKINRYVQDGLRWKRDEYFVRSGGTLTLTNNVATEGPHTFTVVSRSKLPRTARQVNNCAVCNTLGQAHGFDPNSNGPPQFTFLENGVGSTTPPNIDRPGDSLLVGPNKGDSVTAKVTAKKGSTLYFMCLVHPQMQAKLLVR